MIRFLFIIIPMIFTLLSCGEKQVVSEQELKDYVLDPENGLRKQKEKNGISLEVIYRPVELVLAQQLSGETDKEVRRRTFENFDSLSYFILKFSRKGQEIENVYASDNEKFTRVVSYLSSSIGSHIYLVNEGDTLHALDAVYARMFGAATATSVMAVFGKDLGKMNGDLEFHLDDTGLGLGSNEFVFDTDDIKKTPTLNLN